ncbi:Uncharacterised protein [Serratia marcescens]|uniref:Uncharacterized protein n=1 Tax=Serratia marcescens TaxID=615 RepID=A0A379ZA36_SERMA|nr:Uncharacterised protein [Serratia marcescens]
MKPLRPLAYRRDDSGLHRALMQAAQHYLAANGDHRFADGGHAGEGGAVVGAVRPVLWG